MGIKDFFMEEADPKQRKLKKKPNFPLGLKIALWIIAIVLIIWGAVDVLVYGSGILFFALVVILIIIGVIIFQKHKKNEKKL